MIAVLGGGIAGAALAGALAARGARDVVVFDPRPPGAGATGAALGGFRLQHGSALNIELARASRDWFVERADAVAFQAVGYLYLAENEGVAAELERRAELQLACGVPVEHPDPGSLVPFMRLHGYSAANFCALDGVYLPRLILARMRAEAEAAGAEFRYGVSAGPRELEAAEAVAVCAGNWSGEVGDRLGVRLRVDPLERTVWRVCDFARAGAASPPMTLEAGSGYHFREREGELLLMGPGEQDDWGHFRAWLAERVPAAAVEAPLGSWRGAYEMTFDGHPLVGPAGRDRVWASCGYSGHGVMHAPAVAASLAAMMLGESPAHDLSALSPLRTEPLRDLTQL